MKNGSYSQLGQDKWVLEQTQNKTNGYFVEAGATDGVSLSNTYLLESKYGWSGIYHNALTSNRNCHIDFGLLYNSSGETEVLYKCAEESGTKEDFKAETDRLPKRLAGSVEEVTTLTLNNLLDKYNAPKLIDYISLDTEGSEGKILTAIDFNARDVRLWTVEHNSAHRNDDEKYLNSLIQLMSSHGYSYRVKDWDVWFYKT